MKKSTKRFVVLLLIVVLAMLHFACQSGPNRGTAEDMTINIRVNQVGYRPHMPKEAFVITNQNLRRSRFQVLRQEGENWVLAGEFRVGRDRGSWGGNIPGNARYRRPDAQPFRHVWPLDFSSITEPGIYKLRIGPENPALSFETDPANWPEGTEIMAPRRANESYPFPINDNVYDDLLRLSLEFFKFQRCGDTNPRGRGPCHLRDGLIINGPFAGRVIDAVGGWHDAADYINFTVTTSYSTYVMLASYFYFPEQFADPQVDVLEEARIGLDLLERLWLSETDAAGNLIQMLHVQVADNREHARWHTWPEDDVVYYSETARPRMPWDLTIPHHSMGSPPGRPWETSNVGRHPTSAWSLNLWVNGPNGEVPWTWEMDGRRPIQASQPGMGANIAGKTSASFALASHFFPERAERYRELAKEIFYWGLTVPGVAYDGSLGYVETHWYDDMAVAAANLYRITGDRRYLEMAKEFAAMIGIDGMYGPQYSITWSRQFHWVNFEIAMLDPSFKETAAARLRNHFVSVTEVAEYSPWFIASTQWGSTTALTNLVVEAAMYTYLTGNRDLMPMAQRIANFILGNNPWDISFLNSAGTNWFRNPRHRIDRLNKAGTSGLGVNLSALYGGRNNNPVDPGFNLEGAWTGGVVSWAVWVGHQSNRMDPSQPDRFARFQDIRGFYLDNYMDFVSNEVALASNAGGVAFSVFFNALTAP